MKNLKSANILILFFVGGVSLSGCLATRQEIEDLRVDIVRLQNTLVQVQEEQSASLQTSQTVLQGSQADLMAEMHSLNRNLEIVSSHLAENQNRMSRLGARMDDLDKNLSNRLDLISESLTGKKQAVDLSPSSLFELAYNDFMRQRYSQALKGFREYMDKHADTQKAAEAEFYIGECHFVQKKWAKAVKAYDIVLTKYPASSVVPTAYLQKAQSLEKQKKTDAALAIYEAITQKYPHRQESKTAAARLKQWQLSSPAADKPKSKKRQ